MKKLSWAQKQMLKTVRDRGVVNIQAVGGSAYAGVLRTRDALVARGLIQQERGAWSLTPAGLQALEGSK